ncbi:hypothetical protein BDC45DRAFT_521041 [Circinella umbellata]|nr:hypothetical protein BDC45DRAFT_521041 [Circinella umbellata]
MVSQKIYHTTPPKATPRSMWRHCFKKQKEKIDTKDDDDTSFISLEPTIKSSDIIVCARREKIYAVHKEDGRRLWRIKSPIGSSSGIISIYVTEDYKVLLGARGKAACIELRTGKHLWTQKMKRRWICNEVSILSTPYDKPLLSLDSETMSQIRLLADQDNIYNGNKDYQKTSSSSSPRCRSNNDHNLLMDSSSGESVLGKKYNRRSSATCLDEDYDIECQEQNKDPKRVVCATSWGRCYGFDMNTGDQLWRFDCPKGRFGFPTILFDRRSHDKNNKSSSWNLFIACNTMLYCLDPKTGKLQWSEKLSKSRWSISGYVTLATGWSSRLAAESYGGGFSQQPLVQIADLEQNLEATARVAIALLAGGAKPILVYTN